MNKSNLSERILELSGLYETDKEFLEECGITNPAFLSNIKKGANKNPGANYIAKIVEGTGCSAKWLLLGQGDMFEDTDPISTNGKSVSKDILRGLELIQRIELKKDELKDVPIPKDIQKKIDQLLLTILQRRLEG